MARKTIVARRIIVAVVIEKAGKYLITRQGPAGQHPGLWGFPGGRLNDEEYSIEKAAVREVKEETGLDIEAEGLLGIHIDRYDNNQLLFFFVKGKVVSGKLRRCKEIDEFRWLTLQEIENLAPSDIRPPRSWFKAAVVSLKRNKPNRGFFVE